MVTYGEGKWTLQAEAKVREATERALEAARSEVEALGAKARRAAKQRRRLLTRMEDISEGIQSPFITHGATTHDLRSHHDILQRTYRIALPTGAASQSSECLDFLNVLLRKPPQE